MSQNTLEIEREEKKELYAYQKGDIDAIFERLDNAPAQHHLVPITNRWRKNCDFF